MCAVTNPVDQPAPWSGSEPDTAPSSAPAEADRVDPSRVEPSRVEPSRPAPGFDQRGKVRRSRVSGVWVGLIATALFLVLLIIFVAQNSRRVPIHFLGFHGQFSLALAILLSAVLGVLLVSVPGSVRILQLRRALRKNGPHKS
jgi:uncharacterized integral membrane protein